MAFEVCGMVIGVPPIDQVEACLIARLDVCRIPGVYVEASLTLPYIAAGVWRQLDGMQLPGEGMQGFFTELPQERTVRARPPEQSVLQAEQFADVPVTCAPGQVVAVGRERSVVRLVRAGYYPLYHELHQRFGDIAAPLTWWGRASWTLYKMPVLISDSFFDQLGAQPPRVGLYDFADPPGLSREVRWSDEYIWQHRTRVRDDMTPAQVQAELAAGARDLYYVHAHFFLGGYAGQTVQDAIAAVRNGLARCAVEWEIAPGIPLYRIGWHGVSVIDGVLWRSDWHYEPHTQLSRPRTQSGAPYEVQGVLEYGQGSRPGTIVAAPPPRLSARAEVLAARISIL